MKIQADKVNGIYEVKDFDEFFDELTSQNTLLECLKDPEIGTIYAEVDNEMIKSIKEYGYNIYFIPK